MTPKTKTKEEAIADFNAVVEASEETTGLFRELTEAIKERKAKQKAKKARRE